jgi:hypothetical protein
MEIEAAQKVENCILRLAKEAGFLRKVVSWGRDLSQCCIHTAVEIVECWLPILKY